MSRGRGSGHGLRLVLLAAIWFACAAERPAFAADSLERSAARQLGEEGVASYQAGDYATALDRLDRAYATLPTSALALWSARAMEQLGHWVEASERYLQATRIPVDQEGDAKVQESARAEAAEAREALVAKIPLLSIELDGASTDVEVRVGDRPIAPALLGANMPMNPGTVRISARSGAETLVKEVSLAAGERKTVSLSFGEAQKVPAAETASAGSDSAAAAVADDGPAKGSWQRPVGWVGIGLGAAGIALGTAFGLDAISKNDASAAHCDASNNCDSTGDALRYSGLSSATASTVLFAAGAALGVGGITLLLTAPRRDQSAMSLQTFPTVGGAGLRWRYSF